MNRFLNHMAQGRLPFDLNYFGSCGDGVNGIANNNFIWIGRIQFFFKKVLVIVFKYGQAHAVMAAMAY